MGEGATVALAIVTAHTEAAHVAAQQYGHSTVPAVAEELAEVGPVAAGVSHTHQHLLPWERAHALNAPGALAPAPLPVVHVPLQPLASLPSLRYLSIGSCDGLRWWG